MKPLLMNFNKRFFFVAVIIILSISTSCETDVTSCEEMGNCAGDPNYLDAIYSLGAVTETPNIAYGDNTDFQYVDIIEAKENVELKRPLILLSPGGGFRYYNRVADLKNIAKDLATRGYVVGIVYYHVDKDLDYANVSDTQKKWLEGIIDQKTAIRFFKTSATSFRIDPEKIFIGGWSNGGQLAINTAGLQESELTTIANEEIKNPVIEMVENEGGMEGSLHQEVNSSVRGALMLNIYTFDINCIDSNDPAMMFIHHTESRISSLPEIRTIGTFDLNNGEYYGPIPITAKAQEVGFVMGEDLDFITMDGRDYISTINNLDYHEPNFAALSSFNYDQIANFFYRNLE